MDQAGTTEGAAPSARPLRRDAQRNRDLLIAAGREVFAEQGLEATLDDVAERAGVGVGTAYRRFPNKEALMDEIFQQRFEEMGEVLARAEREDRAWTGLSMFLNELFEFQVADRGLKEAFEATAVGCERINESRRALLPRVAALIDRAKAQGDLRDDIEATDLPLIVLMVGRVIDVTRDHRPDTWRRVLPIVLEGMLSRPADDRELPPPLSQRELDEAMDAGLGT